MTTGPAAILVLGERSLGTAARIRAALPGSSVHGLKGRVSGTDATFDEFGATIRELYARDRPLVVLCAAGIVIRALAPLLRDKSAEPPVVAVAEDGSAVVPLLGGVRGVNVLAREIGAALGTAAAITTSGEIRFGTCLLNPPAGYRLRNPENGKAFIADLLAGAGLRIEGEAPWLVEARLPVDPAGTHVARVTTREAEPGPGELIFHPRSIVVTAERVDATLAGRIRAALTQAGLSHLALAVLLVPPQLAGDRQVAMAAADLGLVLRIAEGEGVTVPSGMAPVPDGDGVRLTVAESPEAALAAGRPRGRLAVVGLGPGNAAMMVPAVRQEIDRADDIVGYETYVRMAGPPRPGQVLHASDNREELRRARDALALAASGRSVVVVSSGDPGIFAMAAAVMEALDGTRDPAWHGVELVVLPGVSAAMAAAARAGAPLGHDFCIMSLSDNLKPWPVILERIERAAAGDFVMAFYNPISKARPWQLGEAIALLRRHRAADTPVVLGRDVGRPGESVTALTLGELEPELVDMRTVVIIGSSMTRTIIRQDGTSWVYTPRWYGAAPGDISGS